MLFREFGQVFADDKFVGVERLARFEQRFEAAEDRWPAVADSFESFGAGFKFVVDDRKANDAFLRRWGNFERGAAGRIFFQFGMPADMSSEREQPGRLEFEDDAGQIVVAKGVYQGLPGAVFAAVIYKNYLNRAGLSQLGHNGEKFVADFGHIVGFVVAGNNN